MQLQRLYPRPGETTAEELISRLDLGSRAPADRPYVVLNMVSSLDGKAAVDGSTRAMGGEADRLLFHHLRTQADAIMVGAGTATAERYGRPTKSQELRAKREEEGLAPEPLMVLVSGRLSLTAELPLLQEPDARVVCGHGLRRRGGGRSAGGELPAHRRRPDPAHGHPARGPRNQVGALRGRPDAERLPLRRRAGGRTDPISPHDRGRGRAPTIVAGRELSDPVPAELVSLHEGDGDLFHALANPFSSRTLAGCRNRCTPSADAYPVRYPVGPPMATRSRIPARAPRAPPRTPPTAVAGAPVVELREVSKVYDGGTWAWSAPR